MGPVLSVRRGTLGIHRQSHHAPADWTTCCATIPTTSDQYPQPLIAIRMDTVVFTNRPTTSLAEVAPKRTARFRSAKCTTENAERKIAGDTPTVTRATCGF